MNSPIFISDGYPATENYFGIKYFATIVRMTMVLGNVVVKEEAEKIKKEVGELLKVVKDK